MPVEIGDGALYLPPPHNWTINTKTGGTQLAR
jgi:hypothetical protein